MNARIIQFWIEERSDYKILSLLSEINLVRMAMISLSNIHAASPVEDKYGVTQSNIKTTLVLLDDINHGLEALIRNNQQR